MVVYMHFCMRVYVCMWMNSITWLVDRVGGANPHSHGSKTSAFKRSGGGDLFLFFNHSLFSFSTVKNASEMQFKPIQMFSFSPGGA